MYRHTQRSFVGGLLDAELMGRTDLAKYYEGACRLDNFLVRRQGNISKRRGTELVADLDNLFGDGSCIAHARTIPFASTDTAVGYVLIFAESASGASKCFVCSGDGILVERTFTPSGGGDPTVTREWRRAAYNAPESAAGGTASFAPFALEVPYSGEDFAKIGYFQSGDTMFLTHKSYPVARLTHAEETAFAYERLDFETLGLGSLPATPTIASVTPSEEFEESSGSPRTIEYRATAVVDGVESQPSQPCAVSYNAPWPESGTMTVSVAVQSPAPDHYNIYKRQDSTWGYVGKTTPGEIEVTTMPVNVTGLTQNFTTNKFTVSTGETITRTRATSGPSRLASAAAKRYYNYGERCYVAGNGSFTVDYGNAGCRMDAVHLGVSASMFFGGYGASGSYRAYCMFLATRTVKVKATVTFLDGTTKTVESASHRQGDVKDDTVTYDPSAPGTAITAKVRSFGDSLYLDFEIYGSDVSTADKKLVRSILFQGYTDAEMTTLATGSVSGNYRAIDGDFPGWPEVTGSPFIVHGVHASSGGTTTANTFEDDYITPDASIAPLEIEPRFAEPGQYPSCVCMYSQRLAFAASSDQPFTYWLSRIGDLYNFNPHDTLREDDALEATLPATRHPNINHMVLNRDLILFCDNGEWVVSPVSGNTLSYKTLSAKIQSQTGCSKDLVPFAVGNDIVFANATNEALHATRYNFASDGYEDTELSVLAQGLFRGNPIVSIAYKKDPDSTILCVTADGAIAALAYMREHEVVAWSRCTLGGGMRAIGISADGSTTAGTTNVFVLAQEDLGQYTSYALLRVKEDSPIDGVASAVALDRAETVAVAQGGAATHVPAGMTAVNLATGATYAAGATLPAGATYAVGYPFTAELLTVRPEPGPQDSVQFEVKNAKSVLVRTLEGSKYTVRSYAAPTGIPPTEAGKDPEFAEGGAISLDSSDHKTLIQGCCTGDGRISLVHDSVWPMSVLQIAVDYEIQPLAGSAG